MSKKTPVNTLVIRPFFYLRMPGVAIGGAWREAKEHYTWGGELFPDNAMRLKCTEDGAQIEIQESRDPNSLKTFTFERDAYVAILGNSLMFFEGQLKGSANKGLEES